MLKYWEENTKINNIGAGTNSKTRTVEKIKAEPTNINNVITIYIQADNIPKVTIFGRIHYWGRRHSGEEKFLW